MIQNENGKFMVEHHTHYLEIDGYDKTIWMETGAHKALHNRLRKEKRCNIPVKELSDISHAAGGRTDKRKKYIREYRKTDKRKNWEKQYGQTDKMKQVRREYIVKYRQRIDFNENVGPYLRFHESITYNNATGNFNYSSRFRSNNSHKLYVIDI